MSDRVFHERCYRSDDEVLVEADDDTFYLTAVTRAGLEIRLRVGRELTPMALKIAKDQMFTMLRRENASPSTYPREVRDDDVPWPYQGGSES